MYETLQTEITLKIILLYKPVPTENEWTQK